jgi:hypothetical protein
MKAPRPSARSSTRCGAARDLQEFVRNVEGSAGAANVASRNVNIEFDEAQ